MGALQRRWWWRRPGTRTASRCRFWSSYRDHDSLRREVTYVIAHFAEFPYETTRPKKLPRIAVRITVWQAETVKIQLTEVSRNETMQKISIYFVTWVNHINIQNTTYANEFDNEDDLVEVDLALGFSNFADCIDQVVRQRQRANYHEPLAKAVHPVVVFVEQIELLLDDLPVRLCIIWHCF